MMKPIAVSFGLALVLMGSGSRVAALRGTGAESSSPQQRAIDGITFARDPDTLYASVRELGKALHLPLHWDSESQTLYLADEKVPGEELRRFPDGTQAIQLQALREVGVTVTWDVERADPGGLRDPWVPFRAAPRGLSRLRPRAADGCQLREVVLPLG